MNLAALMLATARRLDGHPAITALGKAALNGAETFHTYGQFAQRSARIAGALRGHGYRPGERIALVMENSAAYFECLIGCWIAGLTAVPVNAKLHPREVAHIAEDSAARLVITTPGLAEALAELPEAVASVERVITAGSPEYDRLLTADAIAPVDLPPEATAWQFYTSGTTGRPKGAMLSHRCLIALCLSYYADLDPVDERDTKLHAAPLSHASGIYGLPHLLRGGHQVILPGFDPAEIGDMLGRYENVTLFGAPTMVTRLINHPGVRNFRVEALRTLYFGGGPMYVADLEEARRIFGPRLFNLYGQGEAPMTITGLNKRLLAAADQEMLASCGIARTGMAVRVADEDDHDLPPGETGEVLVRGDVTMTGYWNMPDATALTMRGGWIHTGDLGTLDERGFLTLKDRSKDMIISGGSNIYPREVEEVLLRHDAVVEVAVVGRPHPEWGEEVIAFVTTRDGEPVSTDVLDALCLENIARFKRPKGYRFVPELPKNNYGKILKTALRETLADEAPAHKETADA